MIFNFDCLKGLTEWTLRCRSKFYRSVTAANVTTSHPLSLQDTVKECTKATVGLFLKLSPQQTCLLDKKTPITPCALFKLSGEQHWRKDCTVYRSCTACLTETRRRATLPQILQGKNQTSSTVASHPAVCFLSLQGSGLKSSSAIVRIFFAPFSRDKFPLPSPLFLGATYKN